MKPQDELEFGELLTRVMAFYRQPVSDFALDVWTDAMRPHELADVRRALTMHARDPERGRFPPMPADVERILGGTPSEHAAVAWSKVIGAVAAVGQYQDVVFDEPEIMAAVRDLGGWPALCLGCNGDKERSFTQHRFAEAYKAYRARTRSAPLDDFPRRLMGNRSPDEEWERRGIKPPRPIPIGNLDGIKRVLSAPGPVDAATVPALLRSRDPGPVPAAESGK